MRSIRQVDTCMILQLIGYNIPALLNSNLAAAICQVEDGERLKSLVMLVRETGWGVVVVQTVSGDHFVVATAHRKHQGNLLGDTRRWTREHGYQFFMKLSDDKFPTPRPNIFLLPDGREIQIQNVLERASNFTHWGLSLEEQIPAGYVRI